MKCKVCKKEHEFKYIVKSRSTCGYVYLPKCLIGKEIKIILKR